MDDQAKTADDAVMEDPQVKADQAKLDEDIAAARAKQAAADEARQKEEEAKAKAAEAAAAAPAAPAPAPVAAPPAAALPAEPVAPTVDEVAAKRNAENLQRAIANGYKEPEQPSAKDRIVAVLDSMEHQIQHNGPITLEMIRELRDVLGLPATPAPVAEG